MQNKKGSLFNIDIRIDNKIIKLKVYQDDSLNDLVERLSKSMSLKQSSKEKLAVKLQNQFRKIMGKKELSNNVKEKLQSLLEQSKLIVVAIDTDKNQPQLNETPFKILQESIIHGRKGSTSKIKKNFQYVEEANLNSKYQSQDIGLQRFEKRSPEDLCFEQLLIRNKNAAARLTEEFSTLALAKQDLSSRSPHFKRKYAYQAQKVRQRELPYFQLNINRFQAKRHQQGHYNIEYEKLRTKNGRNKEGYPLSHNTNRFNEEMNSNQTYQQYKTNCFKGNVTNNVQIFKEQSYHPMSNRQNVRPSKSYTKLNYCNENIGNTIHNYDSKNVCQVKRNYDSLLDTKKLNEAVSYKRLKGKFNYLGE